LLPKHAHRKTHDQREKRKSDESAHANILSNLITFISQAFFASFASLCG